MQQHNQPRLGRLGSGANCLGARSDEDRAGFLLHSWTSGWGGKLKTWFLIGTRFSVFVELHQSPLRCAHRLPSYQSLRLTQVIRACGITRRGLEVITCFLQASRQQFHLFVRLGCCGTGFDCCDRRAQFSTKCEANEQRLPSSLK